MRQLLLAIAAVAVLIEVSGIGPRERHYLRRSLQEGWQRDEYLGASRRFEETAVRLRTSLPPAGSPAVAQASSGEIEEAEYQAEAFRQLARWSGKKGQMYRQAMLSPWSSAPAEPPFIHRQSQGFPALPWPAVAPSSVDEPKG